MITAVAPYFKIIKYENRFQINKLLSQSRINDDFYIVCFTRSGKLTLLGTEINIIAEYNTLLFFQPNVKYHISLTETTKGCVIIFNKAFFDIFNNDTSLEDYLLFNQERIHLTIMLSENNFNEILNIINLLKLENESNLPTSNSNLHHLLGYLLSKSKEKLLFQNKREVDGLSKKRNPIYKKFTEMIESNYTKDRNITSYAKKLNIHPYCLNEISKLSANRTASEMIHKKIISEIKKLILNTDKSFKEIGYTLGFEDPAYFSRYFKKHTKITLTQFQNQNM